MKSLSAASVAAIFSATFSSSGAAQAPTQVGQWFALWDAPYCTISIGNPKELALSIWHVPGSAALEIYFTGAPGRIVEIPNKEFIRGYGPLQYIPSPTQALVQMADGGQPIPVTSLPTTASVSGVLGFAMSDEDFFGNFPSSSELFVRERNYSVGLSYGGATGAMSELQHCVEAKLREWGVDATALAALKRRPQLRLDSWVRYSDYPKDALAQKQGGTVVVRLATDKSGKVTDCAVVLSSGVTSLDDVTCRTALKRAKYKPAIGADGRRTSATFTNYAKFDVLP